MRDRSGELRSTRDTVRALALALPPLSLVVAAVASAPSFGCHGSRVPVPAVGTGRESPGEATCVDYPPPAAKVEELPPRPSDRAVWVDGTWDWRLSRWIWQRGGWTEPLPGSTYVRPKLVRLPNGALVWFPGHWHTREQEREARALGAPSSSASIDCPPPPRPSPSGGLEPNPSALVDASLADGAHEAAPPHEGPVRVYPPDAPSTSPGMIEPDASIPSDASAHPILIEPPS